MKTLLLWRRCVIWRTGREWNCQNRSILKRKEGERTKRRFFWKFRKKQAQYYYVQLKSRRAAGQNYLKGRKLDDETIKAFGLGYSSKYSNSLYQFLKSQGYQDEMLAKSGLITMDEKNGPHDKFWNRVMFPIMDANNRVIGFGGRVMGDAKPSI